MSDTIASYWRFLLAGLIKQAQTGAIVPSQRFLIDKMLAPVPADYRGEVLELGAGTGALTVRLAETRPAARVLACEINPVLAREVQRRLAAAGVSSRVKVSSDSAEHLLGERVRRRLEPPQFIISGIPLGNLGREPALALIRAIHGALAPGGLYVQFQHSLLDRGKIKATFGKLRTVPAFLNFPPAVIYFARK